MPITSTPNDVTEEKQAPSLADVVRMLNTEKLIEFLRGEGLTIQQCSFRNLTQEDHRCQEHLEESILVLPQLEGSVEQTGTNIPHTAWQRFWYDSKITSETQKDFSMRPQQQEIGDESAGKVYYATNDCVTYRRKIDKSSATEVSSSSGPVRDVNWYRQLWWNTGNFHLKAKWNEATNKNNWRSKEPDASLRPFGKRPAHGDGYDGARSLIPKKNEISKEK
ncbi:17270_t:CDS:2 [Acaulospora colombiana]|uniref:17270_t:CDS:1 n=1 Tax=Acaulospora colombiana TaxID=27376 RepID=A0ACA9L4Y3_9GLOM|nr:17270_t:CDS:2 [Acaulospora colombiana]